MPTMTFKVSAQHTEEYMENGYTIFRNLIPSTLLGELRILAAKAQEIAHEKHGPQTQRLQPIVQYLDCTAYFALIDLPELHEAIQFIFGDGFVPGRPPNGDDSHAGILFNPKERPWCMNWHRDWRDNAPGIDIGYWQKNIMNLNLFNQVNCALYEDTCTWVVPGSHKREDTQAEIERFPMRPIPGPDQESANDEEREIAAIEYLESLPGAVSAQLRAGDYML